jgi:cytochrome c peroxidase
MNNLLASVLFFIIITVGCKEVSPYNGPADLPKISYHPKPYLLNIPRDFPQIKIANDNPLTEEGVALGRRLFHDPILSADSTMSCSSCHISSLSFTDGNALSKGIDRKEGRRSAMSLANIGFYKEGLFWDGRVKTLESQALIPIEDTIELHNSLDNVIEKLKAHPDYPVYFRKAFGIDTLSQIDEFLLAKALAQYEKTLISAHSRFDQFREGEATFTEDEQAGYNIFFDASSELPDGECGHCHNAPLMTTNEYLNNGISLANTTEDFTDRGRGEVTGNRFDNGKFRVPSLRNIELTAPYMHDGRFQTLEEVIEHYNSGGHYGPNTSPLIRPLYLNETHKRQLIAFLNTLTDRKFVEDSQQNTIKEY